MMNDNVIYDPVNEYKRTLKSEHEKNTIEFFEDLIVKSGINELQNNKTVEEIKTKENKMNDKSFKLKSTKVLKIFLIILMIVIPIITIIVYFFLESKQLDKSIVIGVTATLGVISLASIIGFTLLIVKKINKKINLLNSIILKIEQEIKELYSVAFTQMEPLNDLFDWSMPLSIMQKSLPIIKFDPYFNIKRYTLLSKEYGLAPIEDDESVLFAQSGEILGNPFVICRILFHEMGVETYYGSIVISWSESYTDSRGNRQTRTRTQTLTASVTEPCPFYGEDQILFYGNDAAPNLSFNRKPTNVDYDNERKMERAEKKLEKRAQKAISKGNSFNLMGNTEFEILFGNTNRDNEIEYRLLFTPLAQTQMINLLKEKEVGFGDNFQFWKMEKMNAITAEHLANADLNTDPERFTSYDVNLSRNKFSQFNMQFFNNIFFAFAPLLAIPLYQQHKSKEYIYPHVYDQNLSSWEHEATANHYDSRNFQHPESVTRNILKTRVLNNSLGIEEVEVTAHGYKGIQRVTVIPVWGGDGRMHNVPVQWVEYIPVEQSSNMIIKTADDLNKYDFKKNLQQNQSWMEYFEERELTNEDIIFRKNLITFIPRTEYSDVDKKFWNKSVPNQKKTKSIAKEFLEDIKEKDDSAK